MKKKIWKIVAVCAFAGALVLAGMVGINYYQQMVAEKDYEAMQNQNSQKEENQVTPTPTVETTPEPSVTVTLTPEPTVTEEPEVKPEIPIDFASLQAKNPDIYAWITIPGTKIDYPIVQSAKDNSYYLNRTAYKKKSASGSIFSENYNSLDFEDYITVLYGHNMRNGSMFAGLHEYEDMSYMKEHSEIIIYTPDAVLRYKVFAAYLTDNRHMLLFYNKGKEALNRRVYLDDIFNQRTMNASLDTTAPVDENSKILTLSTCHGAGKKYRYLVHAYLLEE